VEPGASYFAGRIQKDLNDGNTLVGGMFTAANRSIKNPELTFLHGAAYAGGVDFTQYWNEKSYYVAAKALFSSVRGDEDAIYETQTASARYFQRPDAHHVSLDPTRTSLSGYAGSVLFGRRGQRRIRFETGTAWRSPGFEINDLGYMRSADQINQFTWVGYWVKDPFFVYRNFSVNTNQWTNWDFSGQNLSNAFNVNTNMTFKNNWYFYGGLTRTTESVSNTALRGGPSSKWPGEWDGSFNFSTDSRKKISFSGGAWLNSGDEGFVHARSAWATLSWRPTDAVRFRFSPEWSTCEAEMQYVSTANFGEEERYLFGNLDQKTASLTMRLDFCITPNLTVEFYGQPFVSAGKYSGFKRITSPRARRYRDRFHTFGEGEIEFDAEDEVYSIDEDGNGIDDYFIDNPDFNFKAFNSNLVVRWEFKPGSTLYLVWSQARSGSTMNGDFSFWRDMGDLFEVHPHNVFLVKVSHWFSW
jgi:hypothetical protein